MLTNWRNGLLPDTPDDRVSASRQKTPNGVMLIATQDRRNYVHTALAAAL